MTKWRYVEAAHMLLTQSLNEMGEGQLKQQDSF